MPSLTTRNKKPPGNHHEFSDFPLSLREKDGNKGNAKLVWNKSQQDLWASLVSNDFHVIITSDTNTAHKAAMGNFCPPNSTAS